MNGSYCKCSASKDMKFRLNLTYILFTGLVFFLVNTPMQAATYYSRQNGLSNASSSWSTAGLGGAAAASAPSGLDDVVIGNGYTITTSGLFSVNSIVVQSGGIMTVNSSFRVIGLLGSSTSSNAGTISGTGTFNLNPLFGGTFANTGTLAVGTYSTFNCTMTNSGTMSVTSMTLILSSFTNTGTVNNTGNLVLTNLLGGSTWNNNNGSTLNISGNISYSGSGNTFNASASANTVNFCASGTQNIFSTTYHHLSVSGSGTKTLSGNVTVNSNLTVSGSATLACSTYQITGNGSGILSLSSGTTLSLGNAGSATNVSFPTSYTSANISLNSSSTVIYQSTGAQTVSSTPTSYGHLTIQGGGTKTLAGSIVVNGDLTIAGSAGLDVSASNYSITANQDWTVTSSKTPPFTARSGTVTFSGLGYSDINSSGTETFYNLVINNPGGVSISGGTQQVSSVLTLTNGIVNQMATLEILAGASVSGASDASYVDGMVTKTGNTAFSFPVGGSGVYSPLVISAPSVVTDKFSVGYYYQDPNIAFDVTQKDATITNISRCEYWSMSRTAGSSSVTVTPGWTANSCNITSPTDMRIARWDVTESKWKDHGNGGVTGTISVGTIVSAAALSSFGPITLANVNSTTLPVHLLSFNCKILESNQVQLGWATATEINNDYFSIERSEDGIHFKVVAVVPGSGNSQQVRRYAFTDIHPIAGTTYYRLRQTDYDGKSVCSDLCWTEPYSNHENEISMFPNPASNELFIRNKQYTSAQVLVRDQYGKEVLQTELRHGVDTRLDLSDFSAGIYYMRFISDEGDSFDKRLSIEK